jgi:hypothetical protein
MKKYKHSNHIIKSDLCNENGSWKDEVRDFETDFTKMFDKIMLKHEGKINLDTMSLVANSIVYFKISYAKAFSVKI